MKKSVKQYLTEIREVYRKAAPGYINGVKEIEKLKAEWDTVRDSREFTHEGREKRHEAIQAKQKEIRQKIDRIKEKATQDANEIYRSLEIMFRDYYHPSADRIDNRTLTLLDSGVLTKQEKLELAERDKNNVTMRRLIGKHFVDHEKDEDLRRLGAMLLAEIPDPHLAVAREIMWVGSYTMGSAPLSGDAASENFLKRLDELTDESINNAPGVTVEADAARNEWKRYSAE